MHYLVSNSALDNVLFSMYASQIYIHIYVTFQLLICGSYIAVIFKYPCEMLLTRNMGNIPGAKRLVLATETDRCPTVGDVANLRRNAKFGRIKNSV
jgi:hypothetical protein